MRLTKTRRDLVVTAILAADDTVLDTIDRAGAEYAVADVTQGGDEPAITDPTGPDEGFTPRQAGEHTFAAQFLTDLATAEPAPRAANVDAPEPFPSGAGEPEPPAEQPRARVRGLKPKVTEGDTLLPDQGPHGDEPGSLDALIAAPEPGPDAEAGERAAGATEGPNDDLPEIPALPETAPPAPPADGRPARSFRSRRRAAAPVPPPVAQPVAGAPSSAVPPPAPPPLAAPVAGAPSSPVPPPVAVPPARSDPAPSAPVDRPAVASPVPPPAPAVADRAPVGPPPAPADDDVAPAEPRKGRTERRKVDKGRGWMQVGRRATDKRAAGGRSGRSAAPPAAEPAKLPGASAWIEVTAEPASEPEPQAQPVRRPLGELLVGRGLVSDEQLREALHKQTDSGLRLGNLLVELGLLEDRSLTDALAEQLGMDVMDLGRVDMDPEVVALLDEDDARRLCALPVRRDGARIEVAVADPLAPDLDTQLIEKLGSLVRLTLAVRSDIEHAIDRCYAPAAELGDALRTFQAQREARKAAIIEPQAQTVVDENAPVVKIVNVILEQAVRDRASDVHIEPMTDTVRVRVRTDGALHQITTLPGSMGPSLVSRIKVMSDMNIVEKRRPQDGQMAVTVGGRDLDVRVSTTPTAFGEKCVLRILDKTRAVIELPQLGMAAETYERFSDLIRSPYGMVICAGPTGSGKTTTLYAALTAINKDEINVVTIEDPVEYVFPTINQIQVNEPAGLTFASCLRSVLRQDPDAMLVGEIRDVETARIATQAALTGHFVMSSLHATDATSALHRFMDMGIEPFLIASSLLGVVGQRLIRRMCQHCAEPYTPTPEERSFYERGGGRPDKQDFTQGTGCNFCGHTGYYDRVGIYEVLAVTDEMKELIVTGAPHAELRALAIAQGMTTLRDQAINLVTEDKTTIAEVIRTVYVL